MGFSTFDASIEALQTGFSETAPEFTLQAEDPHPGGTTQWALEEYLEENDLFTPGEDLFLYPVDSGVRFFAGSSIDVSYIGAVDIDADGSVDGLVISSDEGEFVLADDSVLSDYTPSSTVVTVQNISVDTEFFSPEAPTIRDASVFDDELYGTNGDDVIRALSGSDGLYGLGGQDKLYGNAGGDSLHGGRGKDFLIGGRGDDSLAGDAGRDKLKGGRGEDTFVFEKGDGRDVILDFKVRKDSFQIWSGAKEFSDLTFEAKNGGTLVTFSDVKIYVKNVDVDKLDDASLFDFPVLIDY
ncbi:MAG: calcium-binding protein [Arenibacterium sp.]